MLSNVTTKITYALLCKSNVVIQIAGDCCWLLTFAYN